MKVFELKTKRKIKKKDISKKKMIKWKKSSPCLIASIYITSNIISSYQLPELLNRMR